VAIPQLATGAVITLEPNITGAALTATAAGNIDWACASVGQVTANAENLASTKGSVLTKYVPTQCK
jgi:hypothetical protein